MPDDTSNDRVPISQVHPPPEWFADPAHDSIAGTVARAKCRAYANGLVTGFGIGTAVGSILVAIIVWGGVL